MLRKLVERETADAFDLNNSTSIEIMAASYRSLRGYTVISALLDELAFWPTDDSANPDTEIIAAIKPAMATIPNAMLLCASSPYAQRGALYDSFKRHYGKDGDPVLVWKAPTRTMNSTVPQSVIDAAMEADPASAAAEYLAEFRTDLQAFVSREVVEAAIVSGRRELMYRGGIRYTAFVDPSGAATRPSPRVRARSAVMTNVMNRSSRSRACSPGRAGPGRNVEVFPCFFRCIATLCV